jgi:hypothetical protein
MFSTLSLKEKKHPPQWMLFQIVRSMERVRHYKVLS